MLVLWGCAEPEGNNYVKTCVLPNDQAGTISGRWSAIPIPIAAYEGDFNAEEQKVISSAAKTWNSFYQASQKQTLLDVGSAKDAVQSSTAVKPYAICSKGLVSNGKFTSPVVVYKDGKWPYDSQAIALTSFCPVKDTPLNKIYMAVIELNFESFFVEGKRMPDMQSIVAHEFGHIVGLNHSCDTSGAKNMPNCSAASSDYVHALMFPNFSFASSGAGEVRRDLQKNDQGRTNCIYTDSIANPESGTDGNVDGLSQ